MGGAPSGPAAAIPPEKISALGALRRRAGARCFRATGPAVSCRKIGLRRPLAQWCGRTRGWQGAPTGTIIRGSPWMRTCSTPRVSAKFPSLPQIREGRVRALGVSTAVRLPSAPDIPPIAEAGVPGFDAAGWGVFAVPAGTASAIPRPTPEPAKRKR